MSDSEVREYAPAIVRLLQGPVYDEDGPAWKLLLANAAAIGRYFAQIGVFLVVDESEGFAYLTQPGSVIGIWVVLGFCTVLLLTGVTNRDPALYESARIDGAGWLREFVSITVPLLRHEIGGCLTVTVIAALAAFDIVYVSTAGGPGNSTAVPGIQIYILAFTEQRIGLASALAVMLMVMVLVVILPIQRLSREAS